MTERKFKAAIISAGMIANFGHIPAYQSFQDAVTVEAVCDVNEKAASDTARRHNIKSSFTDAAEMLRVVQPDIVSVCTPNATHKSLVRQALEAGANVICEKPLALNYADTKEMFDRARRCNRLLVACQTSRFKREYVAAKEYVDAGLLGTLYYAEINRIRRRGIPTWGTFHKKSASGGGALADIGVHALDALLWMIGAPKVTAVSGCAASHIIRNERGVIYSLAESGAFSGVHNIRPFAPDECDVEEFASGMIRTDNGISINFKVAWAANLPNSAAFSILGNKMGITLPDMKLYSTLGKNQIDSAPRLFELGRFDDRQFPGHYYLVENVINVLLGREELLVKPEETLNVAAAIDLFYRSAAFGREAVFAELSD